MDLCLNKRQSGTCYLDDLIDKRYQGLSRCMRAVTLKADQGVLKQGSVLSDITATGLYILVDKNSTEGNTKAKCILREDVDTTGSENIVVDAYTSGRFFGSALIFAPGNDVRDFIVDFRLLGISLCLKEGEKKNGIW